MSIPEGGWKVGDRAKAFGVMGVITCLSTCLSTVEEEPLWQKDDDKSISYWFTKDGRYASWCKEPSLIFVERPKRKVTKTVERWVNVYPDVFGREHETREGADIARCSECIACVKLTGTYEVEE